MTELRLQLSQRAGQFNTCYGNRNGWQCLAIAVESILQLVRLETPLLLRRTCKQISRSASATTNRAILSVAFKIDDQLSASFDKTVAALNQHITAETISTLPIEDPRRDPLTRINRAIGSGNFRLLIRLGNEESILENLSRAPHARVDVPWEDNIVIRTNLWNTERHEITGRSHDVALVKIDMSDRKVDFNKLMDERTPFVSVTGKGFVNHAGMRILRVLKIERREHNDLPLEMRLQFKNEDP